MAQSFIKFVRGGDMDDLSRQAAEVNNNPADKDINLNAPVAQELGDPVAGATESNSALLQQVDKKSSEVASPTAVDVDTSADAIITNKEGPPNSTADTDNKEILPPDGTLGPVKLNPESEISSPESIADLLKKVADGSTSSVMGVESEITKLREEAGASTPQ